MTEAAPSPLAVLKDFAAFLRHPAVLPPSGWRAPGNLRRWAWLTVLLVAVLIGLALPFLKFWQSTFALPSPEAFGDMPQAWLIPTVVLIAPVAEELLFRGWQSGRPAALWLLGCAVLGAVALVLAMNPDTTLAALGLLLVALIAAAAGWWKLRGRTTPVPWFVAAYPAIFYLAAALFGAVHLINYPMVSLLTVPLILPQLWAALVLGHIRQRIGLSGSIAAHITANSCTLALAMLG